MVKYVRAACLTANTIRPIYLFAWSKYLTAESRPGQLFGYLDSREMEFYNQLRINPGSQTELKQ